MAMTLPTEASSAFAAQKRLRPLHGNDAAGPRPKRRGRPALAAQQRKVVLNMRADREVIDAFRATGPGWQTRINSALREYACAHLALAV